MHRRWVGRRKIGLVLLAIVAAPMAWLDVLITPPDIRAAEPPAYPQIIKTVPERGATDVDPKLAQISVTFDRDMRGGMSWTGGGESFPPTDEGRKARWIDKRTCMLPVTLAEGSYYRVGINSKSFNNFKSSDGVPAPPSAIYFATRGADEAIKARVRAPKIVRVEPADGATDVDPATSELRVTFDMRMQEGMSWTRRGGDYPPAVAHKKPTWSEDGMTCTLPVELEAGHAYRLGLNSLSHNNFQSKWGVPLEPVEYSFRTKE
jgi:Bacterial Ig-like domain